MSATFKCNTYILIDQDFHHLLNSELANNLLTRVNWLGIIDFQNNSFEACIENFYLI